MEASKGVAGCQGFRDINRGAAHFITETRDAGP
jgi:hypothetical protein